MRKVHNLYKGESLINHLRGCVHKVFERREEKEQLLWNELKVAVSHIVHEINVSNISKGACYRTSFGEHHGHQWYCKEHHIYHHLRKWMNNSCRTKNSKYVPLENFPNFQLKKTKKVGILLEPIKAQGRS